MEFPDFKIIAWAKLNDRLARTAGNIPFWRCLLAARDGARFSASIASGLIR